MFVKQNGKGRVFLNAFFFSECLPSRRGPAADPVAEPQHAPSQPYRRRGRGPLHRSPGHGRRRGVGDLGRRREGGSRSC